MPGSEPYTWVGVGLIAGYGLLAALIRALAIRPQVRRFTLAELDAVATELKRPVAPRDGERPAPEWIDQLHKQIEAHRCRLRPRSGWRALPELVLAAFSWSGWEEFAAWRTIHHVERALLLYDEPSSVRAKLARVLAEAGELPPGARREWEQRIREALEREEGGGAGSQDQAKAKATLLHEALGALYDARDAGFAQRVLRQNVATALLVAGLALLLVLHLLDFGVILLAGAAGGFTARVARLLRSARVPADYGLAWSSVLLAPVVGALSGWGGVLLLALLQQLGVLSLEELTLRVPPPSRCFDPDTTAVAFLFGFSEPLLNRIANRAASTFVGDQPPPEGEPPPAR